MSGKLNKWTLGQLRIALDKMGQDTQGTKAVLLQRLEACLNDETPPVKVQGYDPVELRETRTLPTAETKKEPEPKQSVSETV